MRKLVILFVVSMLMALGLSGCQSQEQGGKSDLTKVTVVLDWVPNTNHTGLYVARDLGYYEQEGLAVEIIQPSEGGASQLIAAGQGDFGISYQEEVTIARSQDIPVVAIAAIIQHNTSGFASPVSKNIKTPRDFEGKTYGGWGSPAEDAMIKAVMEQEGADFSQVNILNIGSSDFFTSIEKDVDFTWIYWGWTGIEAQLRNVDLNFIKLQDKHPALDFYTPVIIASEDKIQKNPQLIEKFMRATSHGYQYCMENPLEAADILLKAVPELDRELVTASQEYLAGEYQAEAPRWGEMKSSVWKAYADFMFANQLIEKNINAEEAFTNQFLPE
ncbi:MAG TPA: ABC transporter substrate-binding protein [Syntrophomonadaceae bacterium]|nr:ABC transporter substrate-binding protein [Syntrophomonadaceae bacterium]HQE23855.1 ABC transporter substrate-binding protein [Syntrophomonadaceae bacterium]